MKPQAGRNIERLWLLAVVMVLAIPGVWLAQGGGVYVGNGTDLYSYQLPMRRMLRALLLDGQLPQWNPYVLGGLPLHAGLQLGLLYPPNWLMVLATPEQGIGWLIAGHLALLAIGGCVLANAHAGRPLGTWRPGAAVTAALLVGAGPTWGHIWPGHLSFIEAWAWTPLLAALTMVACRRFDLVAALLAAAVLALQLLAGHPQVTYLSLVGVGVLVVAHGLDPAAAAPAHAETPPSLTRRWSGALLILMLIAASAALLAAAQLLPTWQLRPLLNRSLGASDSLALSFSAPPRFLLTALAPEAFGGPTQRLATFSYHETVAHLGAGGLALLALSLTRLRRRNVVIGLGLAFMLLLTPGRHGPLMEALLPVVPGLDAFRVPSRWLLPVVLLIAALAGEAADDLLSHRSTVPRLARDKTPAPPPALGNRWSAIVLLLLASALAVSAWTCQPDEGWWPALLDTRRVGGADLGQLSGRVRWSLWAGAAASVAVGLAALKPGWRQRVGQLLLGAVMLEALAFGFAHGGERWHRPAEQLDWSATTASTIRKAIGDGRLATAARLRHANWGGAHEVRIAGGYETAVPAWSNRYANRLSRRPIDRYAVNLQVRRPGPWLDRLAVTHLLRHRRDGSAARAFQRWPVVTRASGGLVLHRNPKPLPRATMARRVEVISDRRGALLRLGRLPRDAVVIDQEPPRGTSTGTVTIARQTNDEVHLDVAATGPGVVVLRDVLLDGWSVTVDGAPAKALLVDALFRAVAVPSGRHEVVWTYRAPGLVAGGIVTLLAFILWLVGIRLAYRRSGARAVSLQTERAP